MIWSSSYGSCLKRWSVTICSTSRREWSASKFSPNLKKTTNKTRFLSQGTKENCWTKKTTRNFGMKHCFAWPKLQILRTKGFSFLYNMKDGFTSVSVPKQSHKAQYLLPPKFEQKKSVSFWRTAYICYVLHKKNTWRRLLFVEEFYRAKPALQSFSSGVSFPKKNRRFKKTKKSIAKRSDKFFGLFFCYNKVCFCPWSFFTWKKITVFFEKKKINVNLFQL